MERIVFRVSASPLMGIGHFMRCFTLGRMLKPFYAHIHFLCNYDFPEQLSDMILREGFFLSLLKSEGGSVFHVKKDAEEVAALLEDLHPKWLVIDHYQIGSSWEKKVRSYVGFILVIDDLADRLHDCDVLLDQNLYPNLESRYEGLIPYASRALLGPAYLLLKPEFYRQEIPTVRREIKKVMVNFGGSDPTDEITKVLEMLSRHNDELKEFFFYIIGGPSNLREKEIRHRCEQLENAVYFAHIEMEKLLGSIDLAIGAGGITMWERCFMGVPAGVIIVAENQIEAVKEAARKEVIWNLGLSHEVSQETLLQFLRERLKHPDKNARMSENCFKIMQPLYQNEEHPVVTIMREAL
ncbi:UDP-2,4-diacetamido-2,4,6-trideoxy-beta-L-altropyranose hydrolase [Saccharibacillus endophyticus]|uniref:UDP-2,4-diacetamido-2,4, 6-trideoxy-beta-L-altropyranose hydrolase n=1 Tax=Saccharibacillus endophyticus TaxID=2060666 RepID=A0ABQ2A8R6_9BACL|nr:UDP-2,4-diacetamido-2,4,6-trideoxy-beta-L-altropyranose hydrolase [Saccharibacillus endophyticus]GGH86995.1 UDP-2,4-diacetamido-2,4,6-trideoxy-beta-L-altropyranose hydrolase [Saccharibacillus endophyticus]